MYMIYIHHLKMFIDFLSLFTIFFFFDFMFLFSVLSTHVRLIY